MCSNSVCRTRECDSAKCKILSLCYRSADFRDDQDGGRLTAANSAEPERALQAESHGARGCEYTFTWTKVSVCTWIDFFFIIFFFTDSGVFCVFANWYHTLSVCVAHKKEWVMQCFILLQQCVAYQQQAQMLTNETDKLRSDNVKLYEKIKFLQAYPSKVSPL